MPCGRLNVARAGHYVISQESSLITQARCVAGFDGEVANASVVDVSRMQKLIVTIILGVVYTGALWNIFGDWAAPGPERMPPVAESFLVLLGVSHAGYLASKATPKTAPTG